MKISIAIYLCLFVGGFYCMNKEVYTSKEQKDIERSAILFNQNYHTLADQIEIDQKTFYGVLENRPHLRPLGETLQREDSIHAHFGSWVEDFQKDITYLPSEGQQNELLQQWNQTRGAILVTLDSLISYSEENPIKGVKFDPADLDKLKKEMPVGPKMFEDLHSMFRAARQTETSYQRLLLMSQQMRSEIQHYLMGHTGGSMCDSKGDFKLPVTLVPFVNAAKKGEKYQVKTIMGKSVSWVANTTFYVDGKLVPFSKYGGLKFSKIPQNTGANILEVEMVHQNPKTGEEKRTKTEFVYYATD